MEITITETPISAIKDAEVKWEVAFEIYPIQLRHAREIVEILKKDALFQDMHIDCECRLGSVTHIVMNADRYGIDLTVMPDLLWERLDDHFEAYMSSNGGYASIRA